MGLSNPALPFGLRKVMLYPINADGTKGVGVPLPVSRTFTFTEQESFQTLEGDDQTPASHGGGPTVSWALEAGGISIAAHQVLAGGSSAVTGVTPSSIATYTKLTTDSRPYFQVEGQAISDSGGDVHAIVYRCKADGDIEGSFDNGQFSLTKAKGTGFGDTVGTSPTNKLYEFVQNETVTAVGTTASN